MRWIGQHIHDLISRFRNDVYLEDISTGAIASGGNLGLDSNNKIVKADAGGGDLTAIVAGTGLGGTSLSGPIPTLNVDAAQTQITSIGTIATGEWRGTAITSSYLDADTAHLTTAQTFTGSKTMGTDVKLNFRDANAYINSPEANDLEIVATDITLDAANAINLETDQLKISSTASNDPLIQIRQETDDATGPRLKFNKVRGADGQDGDSCGIIQFQSYDDGTPSTFIAGQIETTIHDATNGQESGEIEIGVANHDGGLGTGLKLTGGSANDEIDVVVGLGTSSITTIAGTLTMGSTAAMTNAGLLSVANQSNVTGLGTISSGVWNGTAVASAYLDADTAHLSGTQSFTGTKTFDETISGAIDGNAATATLAADATTLATPRAINGVNFDGSAAITIPTVRVWGAYIKLLPIDFMPNDDGGTSKGITLNDSGTTGMKPGVAAMELVAIADIPEGFTATDVLIYDNSHDLVVKVYEMSIGGSGMTIKGTGAANTTLSIANVVSTETNFLAIRVETTGTSERVFGGRITIAPN
jgi:hypothetical protein